jgi:hypothetical protein
MDYKSHFTGNLQVTRKFGKVYSKNKSKGLNKLVKPHPPTRNPTQESNMLISLPPKPTPPVR